MEGEKGPTSCYGVLPPNAEALLSSSGWCVCLSSPQEGGGSVCWIAEAIHVNSCFHIGLVFHWCLDQNLLSEGVRQAPEQTAGNRGQPQAGSKPAPFRSLDAISPRVLPHRISQAAWAFGLAVLPQNRDLCPCLGIPNWQWHQTSQTWESDQEVSAIQTIQLFQPSTH